MGILVRIYLLILTSHLVFNIYLTLVLIIFISDGRIDDNTYNSKNSEMHHIELCNIQISNETSASDALRFKNTA